MIIKKKKKIGDLTFGIALVYQVSLSAVLATNYIRRKNVTFKKRQEYKDNL
jgi:uncharacterized membrane protein (DUF485 family)